MVECNGVFERKEVKYRLDAAQYKAVLSAMRGVLPPTRTEARWCEACISTPKEGT